MSNDLLAPRDFLRLPASEKPRLLVVIDTEEEFPWGQGFLRENTSVEAMRGIHGLQAVFDEFGIVPTYVCDYPIATQKLAYEPLRSFQDAGRAVIGAHLHPWVNPPFDEEPSDRLSFPGNLPAELERAKVLALTDALEASFGTRPTIYKAGRYGIGPNTQSILEELGYEFDLSVSPGMPVHHDYEPDFRRFPADPYWFGTSRRLLELPVTNGFVGLARGGGAWLHRLTSSRVGETLRAKAVLSRTRLFERLRLSPEGMDIPEHRRLTEALARRGLGVFTFSFHSPSCSIGYTPYVRSQSDLDAFLDTCRRYFAWFLGEFGGVAATPASVRSLFEPETTPSPASGAPAGHVA